MSLNRFDKNGITVIRPHENITFINSSAFKKRISEIILEEEKKRVILDCSEITFIDSSGVGLVIEAGFKSKKRGGLFVVCNMCPKVISVFNIANLLPTITYAESLESAFKLFE